MKDHLFEFNGVGMKRFGTLTKVSLSLGGITKHTMNGKGQEIFTCKQ